ncbi:MAG: 50S ribosomal protein L16 [Saprospiraceae bacterium]
MKKYRKPHRVKLKQKTVKGSTVSFGDYGLKAIQAGRITNRQIESARIAMTRHMKREGQVWIRIFPDRPITKKPLEVRMGKGKGALDHYVAMVQPGRIMFEITGVSQEVAFEALRLAAQKLPVLTKVSMRPEVVKF